MLWSSEVAKDGNFMRVNGYKDLIVWQKAIDLSVEVYRLVKFLPKTETYALSDQMRRAVVSIPSNIAEGKGRNSAKEFIHFLAIARGSQKELETQIYICTRLEYFTEEDASTAFNLCEEIGKMLNALIIKLQSTEN
jgi:four helix bundle protein